MGCRPPEYLDPADVCMDESIILPHVSVNAEGRMIAYGTPLCRRFSSAACFARISSQGWSGAVPIAEMSMNAAPLRAAALIRWALPSRSTDLGVTPPVPMNP